VSDTLFRLPPHPVLRTARLWLRPIELGDAADVFAYVSDPEVLRYTSGRTPAHIAETEAFLAGVIEEPETLCWGIRLAADDPVVGAIEFNLVAPTAGSIHYALAASMWGKGMMTEAVQAVCTWVFRTLPQLTTIGTTVVVENIGSRRVLEKCRFYHTGEVTDRWEKELETVRLWVYRLDRGGGTGTDRP